MSVCRGTAKEVTIIFQIGVHIGKLKERKPKFGQQTLKGEYHYFQFWFEAYKWANCCTFGPFLGPNDSFRLLSHHILCTTTAGIKNSDSLSLTLTFYRTYGSLCISTAVASGGLSKRLESIDRVMRRSPKHHQCQECPVSQHCCSKFLCSQLVGYRRSAAWVCVYRCQQEAERGGTPTSIM